MTNNVKQHRMDHKTLLYAIAIILCANLHITLFPQIIIILCQEPLHSSSLFLKLAPFTRNRAHTNHALRVRKQSHVLRVPRTEEVFFLVHCFSCLIFFPSHNYKVVRKIFVKKCPIITSPSGTEHSSGLSPVTCFFVLFSLLISWVLMFASLLVQSLL